MYHIFLSIRLFCSIQMYMLCHLAVLHDRSKNNQQHNHTTNNDDNSRRVTYKFAARQTGRRVCKCILRLLSLKFIVDVINEVF